LTPKLEPPAEPDALARTRTGVNLFRPVVALLAAIIVAACTPGLPARRAAPTDSPPTTAPPHPGPTAAVCPPTPSFGASGNESAQGAGTGMTVYVMLFPVTRVLRHGEELKIAWRITGTGSPVFSARSRRSGTIAPSWGPEVHGGSNWNAPGDEYGTGWIFPAAGCWTITVRRDGGAYGQIALQVG
jgi:hypothetical protein